MRARTLLLSALGLAALWAGCSHTSSDVPASSKPAAAAAPASAPEALTAFETVRAVLQSPRCQNCHPASDRPLQGDQSVVHTMDVQRGPDGHGRAAAHCSTCHGKANPPDSYGAHQPPGVTTDWHLPPPDMKMVFVGRSPRELCEQLKDPQRNGGKDMAALLTHVSSDPLVLWGWSPGFGRQPVAVPHADFVSAFRRWADAGGPCPPEAPRTASLP
ncbi:MAG TPA: Isoquinoline 1-oxidoreductase subunit [Myxococcaceae bacterium]|nr:Isoquinoline 1-oxidoreductase subunit [Myxococcaceae bacterium]